MLVSLISVFFIIFIAYQIAKNVDNLFGLYNYLTDMFENIFNNMLEGTFSNKEELMLALEGVNINVFIYSILNIVLSSISFSGEMTFGEIVAPSLATFVYRLIVFLIVFFVILVVIKIFSYLLNFVIKKTGLSPANRFLGLLLGLVKGIIISSIIFIVLSSISSLNISDSLTTFVNSGYVSSHIYERYIVKLFEGLYSLIS